jgi:hypothetical protein
MWLAAILHCVTLESTTCDIMIRTGGFFENKPACVKSVTKMGELLSKNKIYVVTHCFELKALGESI